MGWHTACNKRTGPFGARLQAVNKRRIGGLPALAQVLRDLAPAAKYARIAQPRQALEQRVRAQLQANHKCSRSCIR